MEAKHRLDYIYNHYNTNASKIESIIKENNPESKFSKQTLYNIEKGLTQTITNGLAQILMQVYPDLDFVWLTTGNGSMFKGVTISNNTGSNIVTGNGNKVGGENKGETEKTLSKEDLLEIIRKKDEQIASKDEQIKILLDLLQKK